ncbi:MAG: diphosphomevalonate decarboxylase [Bacteroidetes bacterium]|nr:diphosphomevalonate decarboxylase [Bacteroidota bacterium]
MINKNKYEAAWRCPSNIALVKYWGKKGKQLPANASLSFTLADLYTETKLTCASEEPGNIQVFLDGARQISFEPKIREFLARIDDLLPWLKDYSLTIHTSNNFPHSSGIASSASGLGALALCLAEIHASLSNQSPDVQFASELARLGSGSACRSINGTAAMWGEHPDFHGSSDRYAISVDHLLHPEFQGWMDAVMLVETGSKSVSSTQGHALLQEHPYAKSRFQEANRNMSRLKHVLQQGDIQAFADLVESEALQLHAMMMCSSPSYMLMQPETLRIIKEVRAFREQSGIPVVFTLDAGANVHVLFPGQHRIHLGETLFPMLAEACEGGKYICSTIGPGVKRLT